MIQRLGEQLISGLRSFFLFSFFLLFLPFPSFLHSLFLPLFPSIFFPFPSFKIPLPLPFFHLHLPLLSSHLRPFPLQSRPLNPNKRFGEHCEVSQSVS